MSVEKEEINFVPGHCTGFGDGYQLFHKAGRQDYDYASGVPSFAWLVTRNNRRLVECPLKEVDGHYRMDLDLIRRSIKGSTGIDSV